MTPIITRLLDWFFPGSPLSIVIWLRSLGNNVLSQYLRRPPTTLGDGVIKISSTHSQRLPTIVSYRWWRVLNKHIGGIEDYCRSLTIPDSCITGEHRCNLPTIAVGDILNWVIVQQLLPVLGTPIQAVRPAKNRIPTSKPQHNKRTPRIEVNGGTTCLGGLRIVNKNE
jgi:hypothetical protein